MIQGMLMKTKLLAIFIILFFLMGCATLGLKSEESCNAVIQNGPSGPETRAEPPTVGEWVVCEREAAVATAYAAGGANAEIMCDKIRAQEPSFKSTKSSTISSIGSCS